ncbi:hypothetical protein F5Y16DRAFT_627 [Xylariaceae sp. FL0255]|nr:hypothetical protein F5Y16DRAFT_627 [Xylariaceae sp. FL0255]
MAAQTFLSPALLSELISYILHQHTYPTTLIIYSTKAEFLKTLKEDINHQQSISENKTKDSDDDHHPQQQERHFAEKHALLSSPLYQIATSRHIRIVYIPTVTHLRAYLAAFSPDESKIPPPPPPSLSTTGTSGTTTKPSPHLIIYGFLALHRDTSEWSAQGIGTTAAALVEVSRRLRWRAVIIEPRRHAHRAGGEAANKDEDEAEGGRVIDNDGGRSNGYDVRLEDLLRETCPMLSGGGRKFATTDSDEPVWMGRTVETGRVLGRWFRFQRGVWDDEDEGDGEGGAGDI